jgi:uncharacterized protein YdeI (YjbR/CyaY-like superfamily)
MKPLFFPTPNKLRQWLEANHHTVVELWLGFYKRASGKPSVTWPEAVDQALCFGWIDGVRKSLDDISYVIRLTPRKPSSIWSAVNTKRANELIALGLMRPSGKRAFDARDERKTANYSYERPQKLLPAHERKLKASKRAWAFFAAQPPWYQRAAAHWVESAKKEETREKRLATLIGDCENGRTVAPLTRPKAQP